MGLFWTSADGNDGIGLSAPTPSRRVSRPLVERVAIAAVIGLLVFEKSGVTFEIAVGGGIIMMLLPMATWKQSIEIFGQ
jgi:hypothetical protein